MKKALSALFIFISIISFAQETKSDLQKIIRANFLSPGVEIEFPISAKSTISANAGIGISGSYKNLSHAHGFNYFISPFLDLSYKKIYNRNSRANKGKSLLYNSGNYWGIRLLTNFKEIESHNIVRKDNIDFAFGPTWGLQRAYGRFHFLFDLGPVYYFDTKGNSGFFPIMMQLNLGYNLLAK